MVEIFAGFAHVPNAGYVRSLFLNSLFLLRQQHNTETVRQKYCISYIFQGIFMIVLDV